MTPQPLPLPTSIHPALGAALFATAPPAARSTPGRPCAGRGGRRCHAPSPRPRGFTLVEALIALLVLSVGALALVGLQAMLSRNTDIARQRSEAVRLAQAQMERLRAAASLGVAGAADVPLGSTGGAGGGKRWDALALAAQTTGDSGNTRYKLSPALGGSPAEPMRSALITVRWLDRSGAQASSDAEGFAYNQQVQIASVIALSEPRQSGLLGNPLAPQAAIRRPGDRSLAIPPSALSLGDGRSAVQLAADLVAVLDDATGELRQVCNPDITAATADRIQAMLAAGACSALKGTVVSGHIGRSSADIPWPSGIATADLLRQNPAAGWGVRCRVSDAIDPATGAAVTEGQGSKYYLCVIPLQAPHAWSGTLRLAGVPTSGDLLVCRYQSTVATLDPNERNVQPYADVRTSLRGQNYLVTHAADGQCPASMAMAGVSVGQPHQDCRAGNAAGHATACPASP